MISCPVCWIAPDRTAPVHVQSESRGADAVSCCSCKRLWKRARGLDLSFIFYVNPYHGRQRMCVCWEGKVVFYCGPNADRLVVYGDEALQDNVDLFIVRAHEAAAFLVLDS